MQGLNRVLILGLLGNAPELFKAKNGREYTRLSLATHRPYKNEEGGWESSTDWHSVFVWGKRGQACVQNLKKGSKVMIEGYLSSFETIQEGETRHQTAITASSVEFVQIHSPHQNPAIPAQAAMAV